MNALVQATQDVLEQTNIDGQSVEAIALDTTGSSVIPVDAFMQPLDDYYLWCDHRALQEGLEITRLAHARNLEAIDWCGGVYSHEWGWAKLLHWLRHNPSKRVSFASAFEHCDMVAATLCGITDPKLAKRSACAMDHKWLWNPKWGGYPTEGFFTEIDPLLAGVRDKLSSEILTSDHLAGHLDAAWAEKLGLRERIPIPVGAFDADWDAIGAGCRDGDVVNVVGTSTCIIAMGRHIDLVQGVCGVVPGSVHPAYVGVEAGLSAVGDVFEAIARRAGRDIQQLSQGLDEYAAGQTSLLRLPWDNGDRTVLVRSDLSGVTLGWSLLTTSQDELFAAIEGTAFNTRIILERMQQGGVPIELIIHAGGIPQNNRVLNQIYADVLNRPVLVPSSTSTSVGAGIFAQLAAGIFPSVEAAQEKMCPSHEIYTPSAAAAEYEELFALYRLVYFGFGDRGGAPQSIAEVLSRLKEIAAQARARKKV